MDWTQVVIAIIGAGVSVSTIVLPITLNRSQKKTRRVSSEENEQIKMRIDSVETSVKNLCSKVEETHVTTQGLHLLDVIEHRPHCLETIRQMFSVYSKLGGNGHVERVYRQWESDYGSYYDSGKVPPTLIKNRKNNVQV
jgi:hypothetical protein